MQDIINHIEALKKAFAKLQPLTPENQQRLDKKLRLEWNYNSNHIEGNTLTYGETELLLIFGETKGNHEFREYEEMQGHDVALKLIYDLAADEERDLTEKFIRELNEVLLVRPFYKEAITPDGQSTRRLIKIGEYKSFANSVRLQNGEMFHYADPHETPALMNDLLEWYKDAAANNSKHPIEIAAELHYRFVRIHPFDDGNGRISRLLMNYHLIKKGFPPVIIKSANKKDYLFALHEADTVNMAAFYNYVAEQLLWSYEISIKAAKGESIDEQDDLIKEIEVFKRTLNNSNIAPIEKSYDAIKNIWEGSIKKLFEELSSSLFHYDSLFMKNKINSISNDVARIDKMLGQKIDHIYISKKIIEQSQLNINSLISIGLSFEWNGFKKSGVNTFDINITIRVVFDSYKYKIYSDPYPFIPVEFLYSQQLTESDISKIVKQLGTSILEEIKQKQTLPTS